MLPCSRVGHVFRFVNPYLRAEDMPRKNLFRAARVWMDGYEALALPPSLTPSREELAGLEERRALRASLRCRSFDHYLHTAFREARLCVSVGASLHARANENVSGAGCLSLENVAF